MQNKYIDFSFYLPVWITNYEYWSSQQNAEGADANEQSWSSSGKFNERGNREKTEFLAQGPTPMARQNIIRNFLSHYFTSNYSELDSQPSKGDGAVRSACLFV